jgi:V/A-type H+-transporting ATPase subunit I
VDPPLRHDQATAAQAILSLAARDAETRLGIARAQEEARCIGEKNRDFIFAAEETLRAHVAKNGGASHFATSEYALAGRFWTPEPLARQVRVRLYEALPTGIEVVEEDIHEEVGDSEPPRNVMPTSLKNPPWMRPFELLTELFDVPSAREIDPTAMLAVFFPLFFGFMVGDVGYGGLMALAALCVLRWMGSGSEEAARLCRILLAGGVAGAAFGWLVFADMFGIPFHPEGGLQFAWSQWVPASWLPHPLLVKTETAGVSEMLLLSVTAGWLLMSIGCVFGVANDARHSFRHALGHLGQLLLLTGFFLLIVSMKGLSGTATGRFLWRWPLAPAEAAGLGNAVGGLLAAGLALAVVGEGVGAAVEFFGLFGNIVSFTRLALVGVSKAAAAIAVNSVLLPGLVKGRSLALSVSLLVGLVLAHSVMLFMAAVSASIQSVRLHFCETFMKFFKGQGIKFERFGIVRVYTVP